MEPEARDARTKLLSQILRDSTRIALVLVAGGSAVSFVNLWIGVGSILAGALAWFAAFVVVAPAALEEWRERMP